MSDDRPQEEGLPAWLQGHIHPYPGEDEAQPQPVDAGAPGEGDAIDLLSLFAAAEEPGAADAHLGAGIPTSSAGEVLPWDEEAGADQALPTAGELKGLTGELPWMSDVAADSSPDAQSGPPAQDAALPWLDDETPSSIAAEDAPVADWLAQTPPPAAPGDEAPDWLAVADALGPEEPAADSAEAVPDWLAAADFDADQEAAAPSAGAAPDWLAATGDFGADEEDVYQPAAAEESAGEPEWLITDTGEGPVDLLPEDSGLTYEEWAQTQEEEEKAPSEEELLAQEVPDWFAAIDEGEAGQAEAGGPPAAEAPAAKGPDFVPDWYLGLEEQDTSAAPEWFGDLDFSAEALTAEPVLPTAPPEPQPEPEAPPPTGEMPDWFADLDAAMAPAAEQPRSPTGELEDLFGDMDFTAEAGPIAEVPDWFTGVGDEAPPAPLSEPRPPTGPLDDVGELFGDLDFTPDDAAALAGAAEDAGEAIPSDWLSAIGEETELVSDLPELDAAEPGFDFLADLPSDVGEGELADLFGELDAAAFEAPPSAPAPEAPALEMGEMPDWFAEQGAPAAEAPPAPASPPTGEEMPDWFADLAAAGGPPAAEAPPVPEASSLEAGESPDWLADIQPEDMTSSEVLLAGGEDFMAVIEDELGDFDPLAAAGGVSPDAALITPGDGTLDLDALLAGEELPPMPDAAQPPAAPPGPARTGDAADMPGWLLDARPDDERGGFSVVNAAMRRTEEAPVDDLSDRLQQLREVTRRAAEAAEEAPPASEVAGQVLAGVTGGLTPTHMFEEPTGPEVMLSVALDEAQEARVATLESLLGLDTLHKDEVEIDEDGEPIPVDHVLQAQRVREAARRARARSRFKPSRVVISLLLVVVAVLPFLTDLSGVLQLPVAALDPARHGDLDAQIERLERGDLVLIGFEYGPTSAGEMDALAEVLVSHVLIKGAVPVIVSTSPAGTLHSRDVLATLAADPWLLAQIGRPANRPLQTPHDYVILAYQPGESVGLRYLAECFTGAGALDCSTIVADYRGNPTGLVDVSFALMITLAERGEDVRLWVEQVGAVVPAPLAAGVTVGAEPIARPYFDSGQLIGLLAGYRDAYIYDTVLQAALPPALPLPPAADESPTAAEAAVQPTVTPTPTEAALAFLPTPTPGDGLPTATQQGLITRTPTPSLTPSITQTPTATFTPSPTPTDTLTPTDTFTPRPQDLTQAAIAAASGIPPSSTPTALPTATATPAPLIQVSATPEGGALGGADGTAVADAALLDQAVQPERAYREERWYSLSLGAIAATLLIGLGAIVNIFRSIRRRREQ